MDYFIEIDKLKRFSLIHGNVDHDLLRTVLLRSQDIYIEPILGSLQYRRLLEGVRDENLTTAEETLLGYVQQVLFVAVELRTIEAVTERIRNVGVGVSVEQNYQANNADRQERAKDTRYMDLTFYKNRLKRFLKANEADYPLYKQCVSDGINAERKKSSPLDNVFLSFTKSKDR